MKNAKESNMENKKIKITNTLKINNEACVDIWLEDSYKCRDFLGRINISFLEVFDKGKPAEKKYKDESFEVYYRPKVYSGTEGFINVFDIDAHLDYEVWFYPELYTKDLNIKKNDPIFKKDTKIKKYEELLVNQANDTYAYNLKKVFLEIINLKNRFFGFDKDNFKLIQEVDTIQNLTDKIKHLPEEFQNFYVLDQFGEYRIINSYLSKLTVRTPSNENAISIKNTSVEIILRQKRTDIDKVEIGLGDNIESLMHYIKCLRFSQYDNIDKKRIILSPDYVMLNKKGSIYEHNIYFACLLLNYYSTLYSNNDKIKYKKILENKAEELAKKQSNNLDLTNPLNFENKKISDLENKEDENLKEKTPSGLGDVDKSTNIDENVKLNPKNSEEKTEKKKTKKKDGKKPAAKKGKKEIEEFIEPVINNLIFINLFRVNWFLYAWEH